MRSSRTERTSRSFSKSLSSSSLAPVCRGDFWVSGASWSYHARHSAERAWIESTSEPKVRGTAREMARQLSHTGSGIHSAGLAGSDLRSSAPPAVSSACTAVGVSSPDTCCIFIVSIRHQMTLCRSKRPRWM